MSEQLGLWDNGQNRPEIGAGAAELRAMLAREMRYLLAIETKSGRGSKVSPAGLVHSLGVCLIEDQIMARGKAKVSDGVGQGGLPRFVDVKLTAEDRAGFLNWLKDQHDVVEHIQDFANHGYRVGVSWSGEHQSYTASLTCRDAGSVNEGCCMTSFAGTLEIALWLMVYKHVVMTSGVWVSAKDREVGDFG